MTLTESNRLYEATKIVVMAVCEGLDADLHLHVAEALRGLPADDLDGATPAERFATITAAHRLAAVLELPEHLALDLSKREILTTRRDRAVEAILVWAQDRWGHVPPLADASCIPDPPAATITLNRLPRRGRRAS